MATYRNPILPGFYPDPSICRVGEDYYMVTSTFEYFPGVPIFHSKDLVHWRQLGHVLDRPSQLNLDGIEPSRGIWAPTLRYHDGVFYMITTFVDNEKNQHNFYVTSERPEGPWSEPNWLEDAPGIDPSLLFDDDGKVYYTGNRVPPEGQTHPKNMDIWLQELDLKSGKLVGEKHSVWQGALKVAHAQESPHLYKIGRYYYLMIAEGGTGHTHAVTIARSEHVFGPYEGHKANPILTHRHLGRSFPIANAGHGDLVETTQGEWWMVCLASRPYGGYYRNLGRETFLVPVVWEDEWPVVAPGIGHIPFEHERPQLAEHVWPSLPSCDHFDGDSLGLQWNFLRTPREAFWSLSERPGYMRLKLKPESISEVENPSFVGRRQQHFSFAVRTVMEFEPASESEAAGLALLQNVNYQFRFEYGRAEGKLEVRLVERSDGEEKVLARHPIDQVQRLYMKVEAHEQTYRFYYATQEEQWVALEENADGTILSTDRAGGFVGAYIGMYASSNGKPSSNHADFDWFEYGELGAEG
jgi:xylan 1,4-beta-xylosidase